MLDTTPKLILLPGLDGTGRMFRPLLAELPAELEAAVIAYPVDEVLGQRALADRVEAQLEGTGELVLIAESYSGAVALHLADKLQGRVVAVVLIASFVENPTSSPRWLASLLPDWPFRVPIPGWLLRSFLLGWDAPPRLVDDLAGAIGAVAPRVVAARVREVLRLRADDAPKLTNTPVLYVRATRDQMVRRVAFDTLTDRCPRLEVQDVEGPHLLAQREPEKVSSVILGWVSALPFRAGASSTAETRASDRPPTGCS